MPFNLKTFFLRLISICREFVFKCPRCQFLTKKTAQHYRYGYDLVGSPGEKICLDFVGPLEPTKKGYTSLLTVVNVYTRWFTAWPVKNQKGDLIRDYFLDQGVPSVVHSDNGPAYIAHVFQVAMAAFDVRTTTTPIYNSVFTYEKKPAIKWQPTHIKYSHIEKYVHASC